VLRLGKICARLAQDPIGLPKFAVLPLKSLYLIGLLAGIDLGPFYPSQQRVRRAADLGLIDWQAVQREE
jgi:hypothetical protein